MNNIIIGNAISIIAAIIMIYTGTLKNKKKIILIQSFQIFLLTISNFILGGMSGAIVNISCVIRNILEYKDKLGIKTKIVLTAVTVYFSVKYNNHGLLGYLPIISTIVYLWLINLKDIIKFKYLVIFTNSTWFLYDLLIFAVVMAVFDFVSVITNIISVIKIKKDNRLNKEEKENIENKENKEINDKIIEEKVIN